MHADSVIPMNLAAHGVHGAPMPVQDHTRVRLLVDAHYDFVWRQLRRMGVPEADADDGAQHVFLTAMNMMVSTPNTQERALLFGIVRRVAANKRRAVGRRDAVEGGPMGEHTERATSDIDGPEGRLGQVQARAMLDEILARLPDDQREVFCLFELEEMSLDEVALAVGCARGTAASRLRLARERIARDVQRLRAQGGGASA